MYHKLIPSVFSFILISVVILSVIPSGYSQMGSGLYEGFFIEYENDYFVEAANPTLKAKLEQMMRSLLEDTFSDLDNVRIEIVEITNQGATLRFSEITPSGYSHIFTEFFTYSELSEPPLPFLTSTNPSRGDSIRVNFPGIMFIEFLETRFIKVNGVPREMILFGGESTSTISEGVYGTMGIIYSFDKKTGFFTSEFVSLYSEGAFDAGVGIKVVDMGFTIPTSPASGTILEPNPPTVTQDDRQESPGERQERIDSYGVTGFAFIAIIAIIVVAVIVIKRRS